MSKPTGRKLEFFLARWQPIWVAGQLRFDLHCEVEKFEVVGRAGMRVYDLYEFAHVSPDSHTKNRPPRFFPPHEPRDAKIAPKPLPPIHEKSECAQRDTQLEPNKAPKAY